MGGGHRKHRLSLLEAYHWNCTLALAQRQERHAATQLPASTALSPRALSASVFTPIVGIPAMNRRCKPGLQSHTRRPCSFPLQVVGNGNSAEKAHG
jgi:hypothetical protein